MMNLLALGLVLTSLLTAGIFSPSTGTRNSAADGVIVKDGHRLVVVEFEKDDGGHTKVLISPPDPEKGRASASVNPIEKPEVSAVMEDDTGKSQDTDLATKSEQQVGEERGEGEEGGDEESSGFRPGELVCDAYGKCKHKIATAFGKTKDTVSDKVHAVLDDAKEAASDAADQAQDTISHAKEEISEKVHETKEAAKNIAEEVKNEASRKTESAARETAERADEGIKAAKREGEKEIREIMRGVREVGSDILTYVFSPEKWEPLFGILHLMGFAAAYGMCVWVTFASSSVLAGSLPRGQFAMVQSRIYPVYFRAMAYSVGLAISGHVAMGVPGSFHGFNLMAALGMLLLNMLYLEPLATKVMVERMKKEKEEGGKATTEPRAMGSTAETAGRCSLPTAEGSGRKEKQQQEEVGAELVQLSERLRRLNSYSSLLNVLTLMSLTMHLVHLGHRLRIECR